MTRSRTAPHPRTPSPLSPATVPALLLALLVLFAAPAVRAQGAPSGEYGALPLGGSVDGTLAPIREPETVVFHTYTVAIPAGSGAVTVRVDGRGSDVDLALRSGGPIVDYGDVDFLDVSDDPNPAHTLAAPPAGTLYIDVLNLLPAAVDYTLSVSAAGDANAPSAATAGPNPLASAASDPLPGAFEGDGLRVTVRGGDGEYAGDLALGGRSYPFEASGGDGTLTGSFTSGGSSFPFTATLAGDILTLTSGGSTYAARRVGAGESGAGGDPANPLGAGGATAPNPDDPVLVQGPHGTLTRDNALAFVEALEFSLAQVGYAQSFGEAERAQMLQAIAQEYGSLEPAEQALLAQARAVWMRVQANWAAATRAEREEFVVGVFVLAFGEEAVQEALTGGGGAGGASGAGLGCDSVDACVSRYADPGTVQDTMNAQGCWAAAGCGGYDPIDNSFSYDGYGYD